MSIILAGFLLAQQPLCGTTATVEKNLREKYGESVVAAGITPAGQVFVYANPSSGTFTVLVRRGPMSCVVMGGEGFAMTDPEKPGEQL